MVPPEVVPPDVVPPVVPVWPPVVLPCCWLPAEVPFSFWPDVVEPWEVCEFWIASTAVETLVAWLVSAARAASSASWALT